MERSEGARMELYNTKIRPFRTMRPGQIVSTDILKQLGKMNGIEEKEIPFEMLMERVHSHQRSVSRPLLPFTVFEAVTTKGRLRTTIKAERNDRLLPHAQRQAAMTQTEHGYLEKAVHKGTTNAERPTPKRETAHVADVASGVGEKPVDVSQSFRRGEKAAHPAGGAHTQSADVTSTDAAAPRETSIPREDAQCGGNDDRVSQAPDHPPADHSLTTSDEDDAEEKNEKATVD